MNRGKTYSREEREMLKRHYNKLPIADIMKMLPTRPKGSIQAYAHKIGITNPRKKEHTQTKEELTQYMRNYRKRKAIQHWATKNM